MQSHKRTQPRTWGQATWSNGAENNINVDMAYLSQTSCVSHCLWETKHKHI